MYPRRSTITPEPRLRSAWGCASGRPSKKWKKKSSLGSSGSMGEERCFFDLRSITCVVAIFTTAGSTRVTIELNELDDGMGSGSASGVAFVPANDNAFIADTLPDITVPIRMPTISVAATSPATTILRRRVQSTISLTDSIFRAPLPTPGQCTFGKYNITLRAQFSFPYDAPIV